MNDKLLELYRYIAKTPFEELKWPVLNKLTTSIFIDDDFPENISDKVEDAIYLLDNDILDNWETKDRARLQSYMEEVKEALQKHLVRTGLLKKLKYGTADIDMGKFNRELSESEKRQIQELQRLSFDFYYRLALGGEPLTYSCRESDNPQGQETQVEVSAKINKKLEGVLVDIDFDSDWAARWVRTSRSEAFYLTPDNAWQESSYDGSEFEKK